MSKVSITRSKLDTLANTISAKSGVAAPLTLDQMDAAVQSIPTGDYIRTLVCPQQTFSNAAWDGYTLLTDAQRLIDGDDYIITYDGVEYVCSCEELWGSDRFIGSISVTWSSHSTDVIFPFCVEDWNNMTAPVAHAMDSNQHSIKIEHLELLTTGTTLVSKTITANGTYNASSDSADGYSSVTVSVSGGTPRTSTDLVVSGATVTAPAGVYAQDASASVATGTAGTPTATKGTVSNHSVTVTPSVTNTTGYITGGTNTGTAVTVSASELVSGTLSVDSSGTKDVTNYASVSVPAGTAGTPTATKGSVSNHAVSITPSVTNTAGYISGDTKTGTAVTVSASELVSGSETKTANGTYDVTNLAELIVNVSGTAAKTATGTFTGNGSRSVAITCAFEPDLVYWTSDPGTSASSGTVAGLIARGMMASNRYRNNSTTNSANLQTPITDMNTGGSSYNFRATYADGKVTIYCFSSNARSLFTNSRTYTYTFIKWTS